MGIVSIDFGRLTAVGADRPGTPELGHRIYLATDGGIGTCGFVYVGDIDSLKALHGVLGEYVAKLEAGEKKPEVFKRVERPERPAEAVA